jgi:spore germination cell wall hydrolase CwlJ-like protein
MHKLIIALAALLCAACATAPGPSLAKGELDIGPPPVTATSEELARVMYCEARGEGRLGMRAVAHVAINREMDPRWGGTIDAVLSQPAQFSCWPILDRISYQGEAWDAAQEEAALALAGRTKDPTLGATHYHARRVHPRWAARLDRTVQIGHHVFYA